jgi:hypothetical protein
MEERVGERRFVLKRKNALECPRSSPHSCVVGRGRRKLALRKIVAARDDSFL